MTLVDLKPGEYAVIKRYARENDHTHHLQSLGLTRGTALRVIRFAPFGDPVQIRIRGFDLSIGQSAARLILVEKE